MARRAHADLIEQWLADDSLLVEFKLSNGSWAAASSPSWDANTEYRIKPARVYPVTSMTNSELFLAYKSTDSTDISQPICSCFVAIANAAIKRYIDDQESKK